MKMSYISRVIPLRDFTLILLFDSGELRILDMNPHINSEGIWGQLRDWPIFANVRVQEDFGGLVWTDDLDYCPDSAYMDSHPIPLRILKDLMDAYSSRRQETEYRAAG